MSWRERLRFRHLGSPLLGRILLLNILPLVLLAGLLLSINQFQRSLLVENVVALREQAHIYAGALAASAIGYGANGEERLDDDLARPLLTSLVESSFNAHARLYGPDGYLLVDKCQGMGARADSGIWHVPHDTLLDIFYGKMLSILPLNSVEGNVSFDIVADGEEGGRGHDVIGPGQLEMPPYIRRTATHELVITIVEPVTYKGKTIGEIQLTRRAPEIDKSLFAVRSTILSFLLITLGVTILLSCHLFLTIVRPLWRLVQTSCEMRKPGHGRTDCVPQNLLSRKDEIGFLARALRTSTYTIWARLDDTERFAAEVSHELKNPLSSILAALETLPCIADLESRDRLLAIVRGDVRRLERLIADISEASRVEGDLSRGQREMVDLVPLLSVLVDLHQTTRGEDEAILKLVVEEDGALLGVMAVEDRLVQVLRNLISNAMSFSPPRGVITISVRVLQEEARQDIEVCIDDEGPGIPLGKLEDIFERFYSERPQNESFGQHSGLGLAISRQIIQALDGQLYAENRFSYDCETGEERIFGARFVIRLPRSPVKA